MPHNEELDAEAQISRRKMMGVVVGVINLGLIAVVGLPVAEFVTSPLQTKRKKVWVELMPDDQIAPGEVKEVNFSMKIVDGYHETERKYTVYVRRDEAGVMAIDPACTHLGCRVRYQTDKHRFVCPCHGGVFNDDGTNKSGPPPKPLERHPVKVENGKIWVEREV